LKRHEIECCSWGEEGLQEIGPDFKVKKDYHESLPEVIVFYAIDGTHDGYFETRFADTGRMSDVWCCASARGFREHYNCKNREGKELGLWSNISTIVELTGKGGLAVTKSGPMEENNDFVYWVLYWLLMKIT